MIHLPGLEELGFNLNALFFGFDRFDLVHRCPILMVGQYYGTYYHITSLNRLEIQRVTVECPTRTLWDTNVFFSYD